MIKSVDFLCSLFLKFRRLSGNTAGDGIPANEVGVFFLTWRPFIYLHKGYNSRNKTNYLIKHFSTKSKNSSYNYMHPCVNHAIASCWVVGVSTICQTL